MNYAYSAVKERPELERPALPELIYEPLPEATADYVTSVLEALARPELPSIEL